MTTSERHTLRNSSAFDRLKPITSKESPSRESSTNSPGRFAYNILNKDYGISNNHSASTLQHSTLAWGFSKSPRFPKLMSRDFNHQIELPSTLDKKSTSFGYGSKGDAFELSTRRTQTMPGPDHYLIQSDFQKKGSGKTFGLSYSAYAKTYIPGTNYVPPEIAKDLPGPGTYYNSQIPEPKKSRITIKPRGKMFNESMRINSPPLNHYHPVTTLVESTRFKNTSFGFGAKHDFTKGANKNPGPGSYTLVSCFDKSVDQVRISKGKKSAL